MQFLELVLSLLLASSASPSKVTQSTGGEVAPSSSATRTMKPTDLSTGATWGQVVDGYRGRVREALQASRDPREQLLASYTTLDINDFARLSSPAAQRASGFLLRHAAQASPDDPLLQRVWSRATGAKSGCDLQSPCTDRSMALARIEPDNAAAWEPVIAAAIKEGDFAKAETALAHMASSTYYDDHFEEAALAFRAIYSRFPAPEAPAFLRMDVEKNPWSEFPTTPESHQELYARLAAEHLTRGVDDDDVRIQPESLCEKAMLKSASRKRALDCASVGRLLMRRGDSDGRFYIADTGLDTAQDREMARVLDWRIWMESQEGSHPAPSFASRLHDWFEDIKDIHDAEEADLRDMVRRGIPLAPPPNWRPESGVYGKR